MQLNHYNTNFKPQQFPITIVCDNINNAPNIGSLFRTADAFGIENIVFCGEGITIGRKVTKTSRSTEKFVNYRFAKNTLEVITSLKAKDYQIIALEITSNSKPIHNHQFLQNQPIALIIGDENFGVSESLLNMCDHVLHINMFGQNSSMNVVQATTIALYEITKQLM